MHVWLGKKETDFGYFSKIPSEMEWKPTLCLGKHAATDTSVMGNYQCFFINRGETV